MAAVVDQLRDRTPGRIGRMSKGKAAYLLVLVALAGAAALLWWWTIQGGAGTVIPMLAVNLTGVAILMLAGLVFGIFSDGAEAFFWPRGIGSLDDREQKVWLRDPRKLPTPIQMDRVATDGVNEWMRAHPLPLRSWLRAMAAVGLIFLCFIVVGLFIRSWSACFMMLPACLLIGPLVLRPMNVMYVRWRARAIVAIGRCPSCGYELSQLPIEADGCVICPECGAAWRRASSPPGGAGG